MEGIFAHFDFAGITMNIRPYLFVPFLTKLLFSISFLPICDALPP